MKNILLSFMLILAINSYGQSGQDGNISWNITDSVLTISGTGAMNDYNYQDPPWSAYDSVWTDYGQGTYNGLIKKVVIENGVTSIGAYAFHNSAIASIEIPNSVTSIESGVFRNCFNLKEIDLPDYIVSIGDNAFRQSSITDIIIPNSVTNIGFNAFCRSGLISIKLSDNMKSITDGTFAGCVSLVDIEIPDGVTSIGSNAFAACENLISVDIPNSVVRIGREAFWYCSGLTSIELSDNLTNIGIEAFYSCSSLKSIEIPNGVTHIEHGTFSLCSSLASVEIPNSVISIGQHAFYSCSSLVNIQIPNSVISMEQDAFRNCSSLTSIKIPDSVIAINTGAFRECTNLVSVEIPNNITKIGWEAFSYCSSLENIKIPASVIDLGYATFYNCVSLTTVDVYWNHWDYPIPSFSLPDHIFGNISQITLIIPAYSKMHYEFEGAWKNFGTIIEREIPLTSVSLFPNSARLVAGSLLKPTAIIIPANTTDTLTWYSSNEAVATVDASGEITTLAAGTATITVTTNNGKTATLDVTVFEASAENKQLNDVIIELPIDGGESIIFALELPVGGFVTGSFALTLPEGLVIDIENSTLSESIAEGLQLNITPLGNNTWLIEIVAVTTHSIQLRSATTFRQIVNLAYKADKKVKSGIYEIVLSDIDLMLSDGTNIKKDKLTTDIAISSDITANYLTGGKVEAAIINGKLTVDTPDSETIRVYNTGGMLVFSIIKNEGKVAYNVSNLPDGIYVVTGSKGWNAKVVKQ